MIYWTLFPYDYNPSPERVYIKIYSDFKYADTLDVWGYGKYGAPTYVYDGSLVMGNLMLAAHELGIGSCWIHRAKEEFESDWGKDFLKSLGIEGEYEGIGHCALGYVDGEYPAAPARKENRVFYVK